MCTSIGLVGALHGGYCASPDFGMSVKTLKLYVWHTELVGYQMYLCLLVHCSSNYVSNKAAMHMCYQIDTIGLRFSFLERVVVSGSVQ